LNAGAPPAATSVLRANMPRRTGAIAVGSTAGSSLAPEVVADGLVDAETAGTDLVFGLTWRPIPQVAFKLDHIVRTAEAGSEEQVTSMLSSVGFTEELLNKAVGSLVYSAFGMVIESALERLLAQK
ncbi:MAG: hypothetical protein EBY24_20420, partial [Betaproteobacteria bacterium]|nr:hypothetical protein [Betaproteobacteria bacterium]